MAASANPQDAQTPSPSSATNGAVSSNGVAAAADTQQPSAAAAATTASDSKDNPTKSALRHNPGISADWSADEQSMLEELLAKYASDTTVVRYAKIAMKLKDKTVRDVALRCRWMSKKENGKRRKDDHSSTRKNKEKKEKVLDSSAKSFSYQTKPGGSPYAPPVIPLDNDDGISYKDIGGVTGELLEQNAQIFNQVSANFSAFQIHDNVNLLCKARDNIFTIMNDLKDMPEIMKQMPPLPVKVNEELANSILPRSTIQTKS